MGWLSKFKKSYAIPKEQVAKPKVASGTTVSGGKERDTRARELENKLAFEKDPQKSIAIAEEILSISKNPLDRHFAFNYLEKALYRLREEAGMIERFENACIAHHQEIDSIVPTLRAHDGLLPVIPMYKQMAIHKEKTGDLQAAIEWSKAGLWVYKGDCIKKDHENDLRKRVQRLEAKVNI